MKRKWISIMLCIVFSVSVLAGCGESKENSEAEETEVVLETSEEETTEAEEETEELNDLWLTESEMEVIYSDMEDAIRTEYLEPNNLNAEDFSFPEDFDSWKYFARYSMIRMEEPDATKERIQGLVSTWYDISSEDQTIMSIAAESYYRSVSEMDQLIGIQQFQVSDKMIETARDLLTSNVYVE